MPVRWELIQQRSLAWWLFKSHHTQFNDLYWTHRSAFEHIGVAVQPLSDMDPTSTAISFSKPDRIAGKIREWKSHYAEFDAWTRNAGFIAVVGYLETYIAQIINAALQSSPALLIGGRKEIDGVAQLKRQSVYDFSEHTVRMTKGTWPSRISAYKKLFGSCPFESHCGALEKVRKLRNNSGHAFGRDIETMKLADKTRLTKLPLISDDETQKLLGLAETVARSIEDHIAAEYVGGYEVIRILHHWLTLPTIKYRERAYKAQLFRKYLASLTPQAFYGKERCLEMLDYYKAA